MKVMFALKSRSSICDLLQFHNYNDNKCFCYYLEGMVLQHLKVSLERSVICLDRDSFKLFYFLEHLRSLFANLCDCCCMIYLVYMNYVRFQKSVTWASYSIQNHEGKYSV